MSLIVDALRRAQKEGRVSDSSPHERLFLLSQAPPLSRRRRWVASFAWVGVGFMGGVGAALALFGRGGVRDLFVEATGSVNPREVSSLLLGTAVIVVLEGVIFCLLLLRSNRHWMHQQQRFLHEFFRALHDLEQRNQRAQWDLLLTLRGHVGVRKGQAARAGSEDGSAAARRQESKVGGEDRGLSPDEMELLAALAAGGSKSLAEIHTGENADSLESRLHSLQAKGFIFYSDYSDRVAVLPQARSYIKEVPPGSFVIITPET